MLSLRKKCPYSEIFWSVFCRIWTEYGGLQKKSPYSLRISGNMDKKSPNRCTLHAVCGCKSYCKMILIPEGLPTSLAWLHVVALPCNQQLQEDILLLYQTDSTDML